jgi:hypothetical protein
VAVAPDRAVSPVRAVCEFILRMPGRPDEVRLSERNNVSEGEPVAIDGVRWIVVRREQPMSERADGVPVEARIILRRDIDG